MKQGSAMETKTAQATKEDSYSYIFKSNGLEEEIDRFKESKLREIKFTVVTKHILFSLLALFLSFFLDLAYVPILGNVTINITKSIFPNWTPVNQAFHSVSFWWMPVIAYIFFLLFAYKAYGELRREVKQSTSPDIIDRIIGSSISIIDGIATALPLIGAAILLISIKLGPEVFLGLSVPFEIKALIVLALGKLFEPVLDELSVEFQHVINRANELKNRYYAQTQIEHFQKVIDQLSESTKMSNIAAVADYMPISDLRQYEEVYARMAELSQVMHQNLKNALDMMEKINTLPAVNLQKLGELKTLAESLANASNALKDEKTLKALQSLEQIVVRK
ncbi:MAG: hypothetical protein ACM3UR_08460 [Bacteroidota bacterium]|jgi:hypothetical protein|nr:hypothetical protein [Ignavibacteria bacterium]MCU7497898.1 hypothetical protein [Ignavibacteria bacterium]MCU7511179.1 hypothetical protein [Ignavibacteria bacterium]MCU7518725.1 hypothetical protein [Ignavibacteria bacterium]MCU7522872.1 hypothetical protein [Ignavibacteria bacterium]